MHKINVNVISYNIFYYNLLMWEVIDILLDLQPN